MSTAHTNKRTHTKTRAQLYTFKAIKCIRTHKRIAAVIDDLQMRASRSFVGDSNEKSSSAAVVSYTWSAHGGKYRGSSRDW